ncbi:hypothetical protein G7054_g1651 [Neopestalotiopsis clavispora]|nr:hypothetical protein E8E14_004111 [Neopestalotiopsis sp. 37M]KAF7540065.1 hypothetical protein G7054_g1651 [Neopestalotiopsis clavispora]
MSPPQLRWGIVGTGWIASMFVADLLAPRESGPAEHIITVVGSSSNVEKGQQFVDKVWKDSSAPRPKVFASYQEVYDSPDVDVVYIATPHSLHDQNCLDAIKAGKHVLNEKPFTINSKQAEQVIAAAKAKGVYLMEGMWTRFFPLVIELQKKIQAGAIGRVRRCIIEIGLILDFDSLPKESRLKDPALGAGALLDIGIYPLTYASVILGNGALGTSHPEVAVTPSLTIEDGVDGSGVVVLTYNKGTPEEATAITMSSLHSPNPPDFGRIEGTKGTITLYTDKGPSCPSGFRIKDASGKVEDFPFPQPTGTVGFIYEADAVALDIAAGRTENATMPLDETMRMMRLMDGVRKECGLVYPQDKQ